MGGAYSTHGTDERKKKSPKRDLKRPPGRPLAPNIGVYEKIILKWNLKK